MFNNDAGDITKGLELSDLELHAIKYILEEFATEPNKSLVCIGGIELGANQLKCLVTHVREDAGDKWLCSGVSRVLQFMYLP